VANNKWTVEDVERLLQLIRIMDVCSLDAPLGFDTNGEELNCLSTLIVDERPGPQEIAEENELRENLLKFITELAPREIMIIKMRFGFYDGHPKTLEEIGKEKVIKLTSPTLSPHL
jgi:RNA polymerase primary sigma factor